MNKTFLISLFAPALLLIACADTGFDEATERDKLMQLSRDWSALVASGDIDSFIDYWADDAVVMPPDLPMMEGKAAIREYVEAAFAIPGFEISWETVSASFSDDGKMAYMLEKNRIEFKDANGDSVVSFGKVLTVWRQDSEGDWKNVVDIWNAAPGPGEEAAR